MNDGDNSRHHSFKHKHFPLKQTEKTTKLLCFNFNWLYSQSVIAFLTKKAVIEI